MKYLLHLDDKNLETVDTKQRLLHSIRENPLRKRNAINISGKLGLRQKDTADLLGMSFRTYQRKKLTDEISPVAAENMIKLAELYEVGLNAFDQDIQSLIVWLNSPVAGLNNEKPIGLLSSAMGIELVKDELLRIEYGIY